MKLDPKEKPTRFYSRQQERQIAKSLGGQNILGSGCANFHKGDVLLEEWVIEAKTRITPQESISFQKEWLTGVEQERADMKKSYAAVAFSFGDGQNYYAMDERTFKFLLALSRGEIV